jgi:hypothetical protein
MKLRSFRTFLIAPAVGLAVACGGAEQQPPATPPPAPSAAPADSAAPPTVPSAAPAASAAPDATPAPSASTASSGPSVAAPAKPWAQMSHDERLDVMKKTVLPTMKAAFQGLDAKEFADFSCKTCHGPNIKEGKFDMPNPGLPKLDFKHHLKDEEAKHPDIMKFMQTTVVPQMTTMLGEQPFDMQTMKGFGCGGCHTSK